MKVFTTKFPIINLDFLPTLCAAKRALRNTNLGVISDDDVSSLMVRGDGIGFLIRQPGLPHQATLFIAKRALRNTNLGVISDDGVPPSWYAVMVLASSSGNLDFLSTLRAAKRALRNTNLGVISDDGVPTLMVRGDGIGFLIRQPGLPLNTSCS
ncbi:hypothetical protein O0L34_g13331 [Tuta absoluta]|nr:hypothetical protein O0L34_g13331 [Tuta absoluta]